MHIGDYQAFYIGVKVIDDSHENAAGSGWNGDSVQIAFTNSNRDTITHLYNYAWASSGETITHHEQGHPTTAPDTEASIIREGTTTTYEIKIPAMAMTAATGGMPWGANARFGVGVAVNDGDSGVDGEDIGEGGQKGWSGWGPYTVVYGKTASQAGLVTLGQTPPPACPVSERAEDSPADVVRLACLLVRLSADRYANPQCRVTRVMLCLSATVCVP